MGKKHVIKKTEEEIIKESNKVEEALKKEVKVQPTQRIKDGKIYISSSYNNTLMTLTDRSGNVLSWTSASNIGFKGTKKATPFAASKVAEVMVQRARKLGIENVEILVRGIGSGRESAIRSLATHGLNVISLKDITPIPHNGCRPPKVRRV